MILALSADHLKRLAAELVRAGSREIGGVLVGKHLGGDRFAVLDFSVQRRGGGRAHFRRNPAKAASFVDASIASNGGDPAQVNYLGEWHSHPTCVAIPSSIDVMQMRAIVDDPDEPALFSVLLVVRLAENKLQMSITLFRRGLDAVPVAVELTGPLKVEMPQTDDQAGPNHIAIEREDLNNA